MGAPTSVAGFRGNGTP